MSVFNSLYAGQYDLLYAEKHIGIAIGLKRVGQKVSMRLRTRGKSSVNYACSRSTFRARTFVRTGSAIWRSFAVSR